MKDAASGFGMPLTFPLGVGGAGLGEGGFGLGAGAGEGGVGGEGPGEGPGTGCAGQSAFPVQVLVGSVLHFPPGPTQFPQVLLSPHLLIVGCARMCAYVCFDCLLA